MYLLLILALFSFSSFEAYASSKKSNTKGLGRGLIPFVLPDMASDDGLPKIPKGTPTYDPTAVSAERARVLNMLGFVPIPKPNAKQADSVQPENIEDVKKEPLPDVLFGGNPDPIVVDVKPDHRRRLSISGSLTKG